MLQQRLATLVGGIAVIRVATATEERRKQKKARVENAIRVAKAAAEEGIVPGGGVAYIRAQEALQSFSLESDDENMGISIVRRLSKSLFVRSLRTRGRSILRSSTMSGSAIKQATAITWKPTNSGPHRDGHC